MGCTCYAQRADAADEEIRKLNNEKRSYENLQNLVTAAVSNLNSYKSYYESLNSMLSEIIVAGSGFQVSTCSGKISTIGSVITELEDLSGEIKSALLEIEIELRTQTRISRQRNYTCNSCAAKAAQSTSSSSTSTPKAGGSPSSRVAVAHYLN